jgi:hypothetical protein
MLACAAQAQDRAEFLNLLLGLQLYGFEAPIQCCTRSRNNRTRCLKAVRELGRPLCPE